MNRESFTEIELENIANFNELIKADYSINSKDLTVYFRDLKKHLISQINNAEIVLGAVAWLTDIDILEALSRKPCQIVLQKEDFLRPDMELTLSSNSKKVLRDAYKKLSFNYNTRNFSNKAYELTFDGIYEVEPIRCFGYLMEKYRHCSPKMHNKFLVFAELDDKLKKIKAKKVWSGSANFTKMSMYSLENAILINNEDIASQYLKEYEYIYYLSESLDWNSSWTSPFDHKP